MSDPAKFLGADVPHGCGCSGDLVLIGIIVLVIAGTIGECARVKGHDSPPPQKTHFGG